MPFIDIHIRGRMDPNLLDWLQGMDIQPVSPGEIRLTGEAMDNSAIYGILSSLRTLGFTLISVSVESQPQYHEETTK